MLEKNSDQNLQKILLTVQKITLDQLKMCSCGCGNFGFGNAYGAFGAAGLDHFGAYGAGFGAYGHGLAGYGLAGHGFGHGFAAGYGCGF
jgi:hypothetical protein